MYPQARKLAPAFLVRDKHLVHGRTSYAHSSFFLSFFKKNPRKKKRGCVFLFRWRGILARCAYPALSPNMERARARERAGLHTRQERARVHESERLPPPPHLFFFKKKIENDVVSFSKEPLLPKRGSRRVFQGCDRTTASRMCISFVCVEHGSVRTL